ncbi:MAG: class IV adenylate cyclase [Andreesenia angusta]|nr:class IV adenylate cyclase [Andreesenia angusta]
MNEIEIKVLGIDKDGIEEKIKSLGGELIKDEYQINTVYDDEDGNISSSKVNTYLRIRETKNLIDGVQKTVFTLKTLISNQDVRTSEEIDVKIDSKENLDRILNFLGLKRKYIGKKHRVSYMIDDIKFDLDEWDSKTYPEPYLEIEANDIKELNRALKLLEIEEDMVSTKSITELRRDKGME